jgi:hypothetical protein
MKHSFSARMQGAFRGFGPAFPGGRLLAARAPSRAGAGGQVAHRRCQRAADGARNTRARCARAWSRAWVFAWRARSGASAGGTGPARAGRPGAGAGRCAGLPAGGDAGARAGGCSAHHAARPGGGRLEALSGKLKDQNFISGAELERRDGALKAAQAARSGAGATVQPGQPGGLHATGGRRSGVVTGIEAEPARSWRPARRWCAWRRTARATWCLPCRKTRWPPTCAGPGGGGARLGQRACAGRGTVREVAASADPVTRTFTVKVALAGDCAAAGRHGVRVPQARAGAPRVRRPSSCRPARCARRGRARRCGCRCRPAARCNRSRCRWPRPTATRWSSRRPEARHAGGGDRRACAVAGAEGLGLQQKSAARQAGQAPAAMQVKLSAPVAAAAPLRHRAAGPRFASDHGMTPSARPESPGLQPLALGLEHTRR